MDDGRSASVLRRDQDNGSGWVFVALPALSLVGGWLAYRCPRAVALALGLPGLLWSPFTTPRGDNDGLWTLIVPMMCGLIVVMGVLATVAATLRTRVQFGDLPPPPHP